MMMVSDDVVVMMMMSDAARHSGGGGSKRNRVGTVEERAVQVSHVQRLPRVTATPSSALPIVQEGGKRERGRGGKKRGRRWAGNNREGEGELYM